MLKATKEPTTEKTARTTPRISFQERNSTGLGRHLSFSILGQFSGRHL